MQAGRQSSGSTKQRKIGVQAPLPPPKQNNVRAPRKTKTRASCFDKINTKEVGKKIETRRRTRPEKAIARASALDRTDDFQG
mmetsp:Transcript_3248/g.4671  ORF Transcript_3248/g.4671 Transcript_3248/m.4671 type:complete len:82 (+) Transcript_3248:151-396(+)